MLLVSEKLAHFTPTYDRVGIIYGGEPKEPLPIRLTHK
jgi:hypothetical protein